MKMIDCFICRFSWSLEPDRDPFLVKMKQIQMEIPKEEIKMSGRLDVIVFSAGGI